MNQMTRKCRKILKSPRKFKSCAQSLKSRSKSVFEDHVLGDSYFTADLSEQSPKGRLLRAPISKHKKRYIQKYKLALDETRTPLNTTQYLITRDYCSTAVVEDNPSSSESYESMLDYLTSDIVMNWSDEQPKSSVKEEQRLYEPPSSDLLQKCINHLWLQLQYRESKLTQLKLSQSGQSS
eukprot:TRINITY_DN8609_c0_g1_i1.p1 TRINITY_DN8609_c0_g1~~TRINITY_DN8609_c0_g1_i1.p1  ORF type:complete len:180 (-),score=16.07 TRINITY_DN8609_c0_g1_i1:114-653(-)